MFHTKIITKKPAIRGKNSRAIFLSPNPSLRNPSKYLIKLRITSLSVLFFLDVRAFFALREKSITKRRKAKVVMTVLEIGPHTCSHCIVGICGHECSCEA